MPQLMKALTAICGKVLEFHARALCYFDKSSVSHTLRGMFKQDPWSDLVQDMQSLESEIERFTRLIDAAEMKSGWQKWTERDEKLQEKIEAQQVWQTNQARDGKITRFLRTLYTCPYRDRKDRNRERVLGTCEWFTSHDLFTNWNLSHESCLCGFWLIQAVGSRCSPNIWSIKCSQALIERFATFSSKTIIQTRGLRLLPSRVFCDSSS